ncbi:SDR family oxidoreductase [Curtobacterium pusillum]|uniref:SDR family NAD(P)-dependent oxidoreductase n=1 Tax=Curtobacterium pusillum TaxID=69373 RepID=A0ABX2MC48_9MICO|nr:SDR family NAD(P)-dependent oxidoreductase [Curtobacterium pusillum]NUU12889.1 SDR family NAD(P)-dependent oxidoreductase [Curtobacterium pusillum]GLK30314.1 short-chain dehydrogenase [Curtobacterium pusillum]
MAHRFRGKIVVVTGASSGIGRAAAHEFARRGATLVLAARSHDGLEAAAAECRELGAEAIAIPTDVADEHAVRDLVATTTTRFGRIDVFVGNAGLFAYGLFEQTPTKAFKRIVDTNLYGHLHAITALLPHWKQRGEGTYVLVGSIQSLLSAPYQSAYVTSKHAALGLIDVLGDEFAGTGIRFTALLPSTIDTPIYRNGANYTGKNSHPLPPTVSVQRAGRAVVRAAVHPKRYRFVGRVQASLVPLQYVFPGLFHAITKPMVQTFALRGKGAPTDGNLYAPADAGYATDGGWVATRRRVTRPLLVIGAVTAVAGVALRARR